jgi:hypothetical protein
MMVYLVLIQNVEENLRIWDVPQVFDKEEGACSFYIDGQMKSIKWMCENLLGLDYDKIEEERIAEIR